MTEHLVFTWCWKAFFIKNCKENKHKGKKKISNVRMAANRQFQNRLTSVDAGTGAKPQHSWQKRKEPFRVLI